MLSTKWSRVVVGAVAGAAMVGAVGYGRKVSAMPKRWKDQAQDEAFRPAYNEVPKNYKQDVFHPNFQFPKTPPEGDYTKLPWMNIEFEKNPEEYLNTVLDYCFDGNTECNFRVQNNKVRPWYNAPWMASRPFGREPIHGLTMERPADPGYIASQDKRWVQTWAVGFYNSYGGYTIGQFWEKPWQPNLTNSVKFLPGTVAFKLLFTEATEDEVPSLKGSIEWQAAIGIPDRSLSPTMSRKNVDKILEETMLKRDRGPDAYPLRLIQVDVMIRDPRSKIGWVFGTFMYDYRQRNEDAWRRLVPMCLQWGNDPGLTLETYNRGQRPVETWTNPSVKELQLLPKGRPYLGYLERANGIVDNFISSCASCHSTSSFPAPVKAAPEPPSTPDMVPNTMKWFRNINASDPFEDGFMSLDYSLQLDAGLRGFNGWVKKNPKTSKFF